MALGKVLWPDVPGGEQQRQAPRRVLDDPTRGGVQRLTDNMDLAEDCLRFVLTKVLERFPAELEFLAKREADIEKQLPADQRYEMGLIERLRFVTENPFVRITYTEAIDLLRNSKPFKKKKFKYPVEWGIDLQSEHERWLVEKKFKQPVILTDYPAEIKAFYMRANDDGKTVAAMDVLVPGMASWLVEASGKSASTCSSRSAPISTSRRSTSGGTSTRAASEPRRTPALAWDLKGWSCSPPA